MRGVTRTAIYDCRELVVCPNIKTLYQVVWTKIGNCNQGKLATGAKDPFTFGKYDRYFRKREQFQGEAYQHRIESGPTARKMDCIPTRQEDFRE